MVEGERGSGPAGGKVGSAFETTEPCVEPHPSPSGLTREVGEACVAQVGRWRVVVRIVPDGGDALARARRFIVDRLWDQVMAECDGGDGRCGP